MTYRARCDGRKRRTMKRHTRCRLGAHRMAQYEMRTQGGLALVWMCKHCSATVQAVPHGGAFDIYGSPSGVRWFKWAWAASGGGTVAAFDARYGVTT